MKKVFQILLIMILSVLSVCQKKTDKSQLSENFLWYDIKLFRNTQHWNLVQAVSMENIPRIKSLVNNKGLDVNFREPKFGVNLLMVASFRQWELSVKELLELGADPNLCSNNGSNAVFEASNYGPNWETDIKILKLLLEKGGDPNVIQRTVTKQGSAAIEETPLMHAVECCLGKTKLLVEQGADYNFRNSPNVSVLLRALIGGEEKAKIVRFLLIEKGAEFDFPLITSPNGGSLFIGDMLRDWVYPLDSEKYRIKMEIVDFLKTRGIDYRETPIPPNHYKQFTESYLEKY